MAELSHTRRRSFLRAAAALPLAGAAMGFSSFAEQAHPDARLFALGERMEALEIEKIPLRIAYNDPNNADEDVEPPYFAVDDRQHEIMKQIAREPASTLAGYAVKARALSLVYWHDFSAKAVGIGGDSTDHRLIWSIVSGLSTERTRAA